MSKDAEKILAKWREQTPPEADIQDVLRVVDAFLSPYARSIKKPGSHVIEIYDPVFAKLNLFDGYGRFSIAAHQKKVKKWYLKDIMKAIDTVEMMERVKRERGGTRKQP